MMDKYHQLKGRRLTALFLIGCLLFNYPLLSLFSNDGLLWGWPVLYIYIFISWSVLIGLMILVIESGR
jgi:hypothetical protein